MSMYGKNHDNIVFSPQLKKKKKEGSAYNAGDLSLVPGLGRSPRGGHSNPVFLPGESTYRGVWWVAVHGIAKSQTRLSD